MYNFSTNFFISFMPKSTIFVSNVKFLRMTEFVSMDIVHGVRDRYQVWAYPDEGVKVELGIF